MTARKMRVELVLELVAKSGKIENRENPTFLGKLDFAFFGFSELFCCVSFGGMTLSIVF